MKKLLALLLSLLTICTALFSVACVDYGEEERSDITYLYVNTRENGFKADYLRALEADFESTYARTSFADGKTGIDLVVGEDYNLSQDGFYSKIPTSTFNVHIVEGLYYFNYANSSLVLDISDWIKETIPGENKSIEDKMYDDQKESLTAVGGKYYALPVFASASGLTYNADLFKDRLFYFADEGGFKPFATSSYTGKTYTGKGFIQDIDDEKSCGPNGVYENGEGDDGLPSTYEEFFYLLDYMLDEDVIPLIWTGKSNHYTNYLATALQTFMMSKAERVASFSFDSGNEPFRYVDGFDKDGNPIVKETTITPDNGYLVKQSYASYLSLKFQEALYTHGKDGKNYYDSRVIGQGLSNTTAQNVYMNSTTDMNDKNDIAMLIEGSYWYNEAGKETDPVGKTRGFKMMRLPSKELGTVAEGEIINSAMVDGFYKYMVVNKNIENNEEKLKAAKAFVQYFYKDASLQKITTTTGIPVGIKYDLTNQQYNGLSIFGKSSWDIYKEAMQKDSYVTPLSKSGIFFKHYNTFTTNSLGYSFKSTINGLARNLVFEAMTQYDATARDYFDGMKIDKTTWDSNYKIYA